MTEYSNLVSIEILLAWPALVLILLLIDRRHGQLPLFLSYAYIAALAVQHWPGGLAHAMPWNPFHGSTNTIVGMNYTTLALVFFVLGTAIIPGPQRNAFTGKLQSTATIEKGNLCAKVLLIAGVAAWMIELT